MTLDEAIKGMMSARKSLRSKSGISQPMHISEQMMRLAAYTTAVEEHLAQLEEDLEVEEMNKFIKYTQAEGRSVNQAETLAKQEVGKLKGEIAKLKRYVNSSWQIVGVAQSRWNHLAKEATTQM